jgi:preprotein translocase subunit SecF
VFLCKKKAKKSGPNISKLEWGMVISILGIIDIAQFVLDWIGIPFIATVGTYSSLFVASPLLVLAAKHFPNKN